MFSNYSILHWSTGPRSIAPEEYCILGPGGPVSPLLGLYNLCSYSIHVQPLNMGIHPSATHGPSCLTSVIFRELVFPIWYRRSLNFSHHSRTFLTGWDVILKKKGWRRELILPVPLYLPAFHPCQSPPFIFWLLISPIDYTGIADPPPPPSQLMRLTKYKIQVSITPGNSAEYLPGG